MAMSSSITRITVPSSQRTKPATRPMNRPKPTVSTVTRAPIVSEIRVPFSVRDRVERPSWSVPNQCSTPGGRRRWIGFTRTGSGRM
ncbi:hypothetical protein BTHI11S_01451 [Bosea thiooxidans]